VDEEIGQLHERASAASGALHAERSKATRAAWPGGEGRR
jgi:hypothetical protein